MTRLDPKRQGWMSMPETRAVLAALGEARFVGGAVRNALLGFKVGDIDVRDIASPQRIAHRAADETRITQRLHHRACFRRLHPGMAKGIEFCHAAFSFSAKLTRIAAVAPHI